MGPKLRHSGMKRKADTDLEDSTVKSWQAGSEDPRYHKEGQREVARNSDLQEKIRLTISRMDAAGNGLPMQSIRSPTGTKTLKPVRAEPTAKVDYQLRVDSDAEQIQSLDEL